MQQTLTIRLLTEAKDGSFGKNEVHTMTPEDGIERIVKAFANLYIEIEGTGITYTPREAAEAALNALLEEK